MNSALVFLNLIVLNRISLLKKLDTVVVRVITKMFVYFGNIFWTSFLKRYNGPSFSLAVALDAVNVTGEGKANIYYAKNCRYER